MTATEIVRNEIMKKGGIRISTLANRMNMSAHTITARLSMDNISINKLNEMLHALDCKLLIVPSNVEEKDGWYRIE